MTPEPLAYVDSQPVNIRDMDDLEACVDDALADGRGFTLFTLNLDHLVKRRQSPNFRTAYARASFVTADGWPIVALGRRTSPRLALVAGSDSLMPLCALAAKRCIPVAFYGSKQDVLGTAADRLRGLYPGLEIALTEAPAFGFDPLGEAGADAIARIAASGARLCFVALGAPKQELFADRAVRSCPQVGFVCIGAALDFVAGAQTRAPRLVRTLRLEWAWRLALNPRRLGLRYLRCALLFARLLVQARPGVAGERPA